MTPVRFEGLAKWSLRISIANAAFVATWSLVWAFGLGRWARASLSPLHALALQVIWVPSMLVTMVLTFTVAARAQRRWREAVERAEHEAQEREL